MGTRSLSSPRMTASISATVANLLDSGKSAQGGIALSRDLKLSNGINASQANRAVEYSATISSGGSLVIDLYDWASVDGGAGSGNDITGQPLVLEEIVVIMITNENAVGDAGLLQIEPDTSNGWSPVGSHTVANGGALRGQGVLLKAQPAEAGFDVTDASSHRIKLSASGAGVLFKIAVLGRNDDDDSSSSSSSQSSSSQSSSSQSSSSSSSQSSSSSSSSP